MSLVRNSSRRRHAWASCLLLAGLSLSTLTACPPAPVASFDPDSVEDPALDPRGQFDLRVKPDIAGTAEAPGSCTCHYTKRDAYEPFMKYDAGIRHHYGVQRRQVPDDQRRHQPADPEGSHQGPALTQPQFDRARAWLQAEALSRGAGGGSKSTPTVALRTGDFYINLEPLTGDPLSKITFTLGQSGSRTLSGDRAEALRRTDDGHPRQAPALHHLLGDWCQRRYQRCLGHRRSDGPGQHELEHRQRQLLLSNLPATTARIALAFEAIDKVSPNPNIVLMCKSYNLYKPAVTNYLAGCAAICHSPTGTDSRASQATNAFNMAASRGTVDADIQKALHLHPGPHQPGGPGQERAFDPGHPVADGGTSNHPYKLDTPAKISRASRTQS